jgi:hypothetical protein
VAERLRTRILAASGSDSGRRITGASVAPGLSAGPAAEVLLCEIDGGVGFMAVRAPDRKPKPALSA